jgi:hypothetical protein
MTNFKGFASLVLAATIVSTLSAETHCPGNEASVPLHLVNRYQMIVAVSANHSGPYNLLLNTRAQIIVIYPSLADELRLRSLAKTKGASVRVHSSADLAELDQLDADNHAVANQSGLQRSFTVSPLQNTRITSVEIPRVSFLEKLVGLVTANFVGLQIAEHYPHFFNAFTHLEQVPHPRQAKLRPALSTPDIPSTRQEVICGN